jgi:hypothetical protein
MISILTISFEVQAFELGELFKVLHFAETFEVEVKLLVQFGCPIILFPFGSEHFTEESVGQDWVTILISLDISTLLTFPSSSKSWVGTTILAGT